MNYRNEIILYLHHDCGFSYTQIVKMNDSDIINSTIDNPELNEWASNNIDILKSVKTGNNISVRAIQDMVHRYKIKLEQTKHVTILHKYDSEGFCGYTPMESLSLDEEFEERLKNADLLTFLRGCGYNNQELTLNQIRKSTRSFDKSKLAVLYIHKVNDNKHHIEFIKFGITNIDTQKLTKSTKEQLAQQRIKSQIYNSSRDVPYKFKSEMLWCSEVLDGEFIFNTELAIKQELSKFDKVPKSIFSDGRSETVLIENKDILELMINSKFNIDIVL